MEVEVYGPLRSATGEKRVEVAFAGGTVADAVAAFAAEYPRARGQLYGDDGELRPSVRVLRGGDRVDPATPCGPDDELALFPAVQGGRSPTDGG